MSSASGTERPYRSLFCSFLWPRHPGRSGGEIRDFHLLRRLLTQSAVEAFALQADAPERADPLAEQVESLHVPDRLATPSAALRLRVALRRLGLPVPGPMLHSDVGHKLAAVETLAPLVQQALDRDDPDFVFVSPQLNPLALRLDTRRTRARLVLATYDVEAVRMERLAGSAPWLRRPGMKAEAARAAAFERAQLLRFDGVIAVSDLDRQAFVERYGLVPERVLVVENGVDPDYFAFRERPEAVPPEVVFVGALGYRSNAEAAWRLARDVMPRLRRARPEVTLRLVGQGPDAALRSRHDGRLTVVTGAVDDVRPHLARATVACLPLVSGSGTKYKLLEALSAGVPVVCSPLAAEGLAVEHGRHLLVAETDDAVAAAVGRLLDDADLAHRIAHAGRRLVAERYAWDVNLPRLDPWLLEIARWPKGRSVEAPSPP